MQPIREWRLIRTRHLARFVWRVLGAFLRNRGILLAGGVGYNVMLSIVPLLALLSVLLTHVVDEQHLIGVIAIQTQHLAPAHAGILLEAVEALLDSRDAIGMLGILVLLLFSSFAFRMLEDAMAIIFHQPDNPSRRSFWVSAILPYAFMLVLGFGLMGLTLLVSMATALNTLVSAIFGNGLPLAGVSMAMLNTLSFVGMFFMFSAIYKILPVVRISVRRALVGGFVAALLWEGVRLLLVVYFANISFVNVVYGSLATLIVVLLSLEVGAIILLLGAQVIAELERSARAGVPWHVNPRQAVITRVD
ncbi:MULTISPECIES: YihY/virulence factor BrkB family protein [Halomonadaceae]|uniref:YihY/virulence factor BrkB family protein n=1 Tax=Halomonadaceae TaxID=28256 RepID=UPI00159B3EA8|nr:MULTISPECIES: YihY/virulence factor BrkB family protein [Halomonas]QJQ94219.1 YihY/virulence factor BrkB family protein [Halomonas sp. PA5]